MNELLKRTTKAHPETVTEPKKTLLDQFADVIDPFLQKELRKFIRGRLPTFLVLREKALRWSKEEERPQHTMPRPPLSQVVSADTPDGNSQCSGSSSANPMDEVLEVQQNQQKSLEELTRSNSQGYKPTQKMEWTVP